MTKKFIVKEPLLTIKQNGYISGLVFMVYLKVQEALAAEEERMLIQSMVNMEEFACGLRLRLRKMLVLRCKLVRTVKGRRKKRLWARRSTGEGEGGEMGG